MDIRKIKTLIEMLEASNLNEIEVSQGEESVRISKSSGEMKMRAPLRMSIPLTTPSGTM